MRVICVITLVIASLNVPLANSEFYYGTFPSTFKWGYATGIFYRKLEQL